MTRGAFVLITNDIGEVLLVRSLTSLKFTDHWSIPGGVVEAYETYEQGAVREVLEEVGIDIEIGVRLSSIDSKDTGISAVTFKAAYISGEIRLQPQEIEKAEWFTIEEAKKLKLGFNIADLIEYL
jgi:8-oxo-dGTP diphosphatase